MMPNERMQHALLHSLISSLAKLIFSRDGRHRKTDGHTPTAHASCHAAVSQQVMAVKQSTIIAHSACIMSCCRLAAGKGHTTSCTGIAYRACIMSCSWDRRERYLQNLQFSLIFIDTVHNDVLSKQCSGDLYESYMYSASYCSELEISA